MNEKKDDKKRYFPAEIRRGEKSVFAWHSRLSWRKERLQGKKEMKG